jgi:mannose-1-phosphate guanylyltransferase
MSPRERTWVMVLAGGAADPRESQKGHVNDPEQNRFGALLGPRSLLKMTLSRARLIVPSERICLVVDRAQKRYWSSSLSKLSSGNVIVQPCHRGSAVEILLAVLAILERDAWARIVVMPSNHYVDDEPALASSLLDAATPTAQTRNSLTLVGFKPEEADPELGYIVPGRWFEDGTRSVQRVVHSAGKALARELVARGALWDSSIVAARAVVLLNVLRARMPDLVDQMETALAQGDSSDERANALTQLYSRLPSVDFSLLVAKGAEPECRVITSRSCGWSNLGTAQRVAAVMRRVQLSVESSSTTMTEYSGLGSTGTVTRYADPDRHHKRGAADDR